MKKRTAIPHQRVLNLASLLVSVGMASGFACSAGRHQEVKITFGHHHYPTATYATSRSDNENDNGGDSDDGEEDIITRKLRRNSEKPLIDAMKEHDKMMEDNKVEAVSDDNNINSSSDTSKLYSYMLANTVHHDFDPDVSHEETYLNEQFKALLSRKGDDLTRLGPGIATLPLDPSSEEAAIEDKLAAKEMELQTIIDELKETALSKWDESNLEHTHQKQTEVMERGRQLQLEIDQLHVDDCGAVLLANLEFYEAFSSRDAEWMKNVWWQSPSAICVHPSHSPLIGSNAIVDSFSKMFENGIKNTSRIRGGTSTSGSFMTPTNIRALSVRGTTASLVCDEEVYAKGSLGESEQNRALVNKLLATNIFRRIGGKWKMVHRHASWHPETAAARDAMKAEPGIVIYDDDENDIKRNSDAVRAKQGMTLRKVSSEGSTSKRPVKLTSIPQSLDGLDANAVLGIPLPKVDEPKKSKKNDDGVIGKIINLSDLLGGESDGDDDEKGLGDVLADLFGGSADSDSTSISGKGTPDDPFIKRRVIKIGPDGIENLKASKNNNVKGNDNKEKNITIDLRGKSEEERKQLLSQLVPQLVGGVSSGEDDSDDEEFEDDSIDVPVSTTYTDNKENLRQKCISTLRKLSENGMISGKQKRVLLTDIITSSARGETSLIETAYELLCADKDVVGSDSCDGMEDFSEQCRVFAEVEREY
jgi:ketosteroid isomerase-like protein